MPNTEGVQEAIDDLGAQLEAEFAARFAEPEENEDLGGGDGAPAEPPAAGVEDPPPPVTAAGDESPATFTVEIDGQKLELTEDHIRHLVSLQGWAQSLPREVAEQFQAIEAGRARAVEQAEWEAYQRWAAQQRPAGGAPAIDPDELEPEVAEVLRRQQAELQALQAERDQRLVAQQRDQHTEIIGHLEAAQARFAEQHKLSPEQVEAVAEYTASLRVLPQMVEAARVYSPTGQLIQDADYEQVFSRALEVGLNAHPTLSNEVIERRVAERLAAERARSEAVDGKRARAASLASVPSAAVPRDPQMNVQRLSSADTAAQVAAVIRQHMNGGGEP